MHRTVGKVMVWSAALLVVAAAGCQQANPPVEEPEADTQSAVDVQAQGDATKDAADVQKNDVSEQVLDADAGADGASGDTLESDTATGTGCDFPANPKVGEPGASCKQAADCDSGYCVEGPSGKICSQTCVNCCPTGFSCSQIGGSSDTSFVSLAQFISLCKPCGADAECNAENPNALCVSYGASGSFCGGGCEATSDCPGGYSCKLVSGTSGAGKQCVRQTGECTCSEKAILAGATTTCEVKNGVGTCEGTRGCTLDGLSPCKAANASPEVCNGVDDNCNGATDEGLLTTFHADADSDGFGSATAVIQACTLPTGYVTDTADCDDNNASVHPGVVDVCNGLDDDCNSVVDNTSCDDGNVCTIDTCLGAGGCVHPLTTIACNDANACTVGDSCMAGACNGSALGCDDGNACTADACLPASGCTHSNVSSACNDGNACTSGDTCQSGGCVGLPKVCDDNNGCTADSCQPASGCVHATTFAGCDDGNACTVSDSCQSGQCAGVAVGCDDANPCTDDVCVGLAGCEHVHNNKPCNDGDTCTLGDTCAVGLCQGATVDCDDTNLCTADSCDANQGCLHVGNSSACNDGNPCTTDLCDAILGCTTSNNSANCNDGSPCTTGDQCKAGVCSGSPISCDDANMCTDDACEAGKGCVHAFNALGCNDGNACTNKDTCGDGTCFGTLINCEDDDLCTADSCDVVVGCLHPFSSAQCNDGNLCTTDDCFDKGQCSHADNTLACVDGSACTGDDVCAGGVCTATAINCDDGNVCTADACDPAKGCVYSTVPGDCDDKNACTNSDFCSGGKCGGNTTNCGDGNACTTDTCDKVDGCAHAPVNSPCSDGNLCTSGDICSAGTCAGVALVCADDNICTSDSCESAIGCVYDNVSSACNDGSTCTTSDGCTGGVCGGTPINCDDANACSVDTCDAVLGCQHTTAANGTVCGTDQWCFLGKCSAVQSYAIALATNASCPTTHIKIGLVNGTNLCAPDYPAWGIRSLSPDGYLVDGGDGTVSDKNTFLTWQKADSGTTDKTFDGAQAYCQGLDLQNVTDWRLPTVAELLTLRDATVTSAPIIGSVFAASTVTTKNYWTASPDSSKTRQWVGSFKNGTTKIADKSVPARARCVRSPFLTTQVPGQRFDIASIPGVAIDKVTNRQWQIAMSPSSYSFSAATTYCNALVLDNAGWSVPNIVELESLVDRTEKGAALPATPFPSASTDAVWSSSTNYFSALNYWGITFVDGATVSESIFSVAASNRVRCMR